MRAGAEAGGIGVGDELENVDVSGTFRSESPAMVRVETVGTEGKGLSPGESDRLSFARQILFFLFLICIFVFGAYFLQPESKAAAAVFELVKVGVLPLVTLVIGFYFPNNNK